MQQKRTIIKYDSMHARYIGTTQNKSTIFAIHNGERIFCPAALHRVKTGAAKRTYIFVTYQ